MLNYILSKLFYGFWVILGVVIIVFLIFHVLPGDPVSMMAGQRTDVSTKEAIIEELGLNKPLPVQLVQYLNDLNPISIHENTRDNELKYSYLKIFSFGKEVLVLKAPYLRRSFQSNKKVSEIIFEHVEGTFWLAFFAMLFATILGIGIGIIAALNQDMWLDRLLVSLSILGISVPSFVAAILAALIFGYYLADYTGLNITGQLWVTDSYQGKHLEFKNLLLPALTLGIRPLAIIVQLTRSSMIEVLSQDYIRTAKAKGLNKYDIVMKHALKNALNPVITAISGWLASLMAGGFFIEYIFNWKGIGLVTIQAIETLDFPVVMGTTIFVALVFILVNLVVDIFYSIIDPRVRIF